MKDAFTFLITLSSFDKFNLRQYVSLVFLMSFGRLLLTVGFFEWKINLIILKSLNLKYYGTE